MIGWCLSVLAAHWRRHPGQAATLVLGLALATALWSGVQAINAEARQSYDRAAQAIGGGELSAVVRPGGLVTTPEYVALRRAGWKVSPIVNGWIDVGDGRVRLVGIDPLTAPDGTAALGAMANAPSDALGNGGTLFAASNKADRLRESLGFPVAEVAEIPPGMAFADISLALRLLDRPDGFERLVISPGGQRTAPLPDGLVIEAASATQDMAALTDSFHLNLTAFGLLSFAVGLFIVNGAVGLAFEQRRATVRTMRAHGLPLFALVIALVIELGAFALISGLLGIALGYAIAAALIPDVAATLRGLYGATIDGSLTLRPAWWLGGLGMTGAGTALAAAGGLIALARMPILAPARPRAWSMLAVSRTRWMVGAALACLAVAAIAGLFGSGLVAGFVLLGALLLSAALALPFLIERILSAASRAARSAPAEWFWADTRQQMRGLSLALMALLLALAANIGVGTMVASFRITFTSWLDQRLASELYVTAETEEQADALRAFAAEVATAILPIWRAEAPIAGRPGEIYSVADHPTYRENWPMIEALPDAWDIVARGTGAILNEQTARAADLWPGDTLRIGTDDFVLAGVYSDYGNPGAQALIATEAFVQAFPDAPRLNFGLRVAPDSVPSVMARLQNELGFEPSRMVDQAGLKAVSLAVFERTFAVTGALNVLTFGVAAFAILTALLTLSSLRLPQVAPVWALGLTRARLAQLEVLRALALGGITAVLAVPVGLVLAWVLLSVINVEAFGWRLPMRLFPMQWALLGSAAIVAAGLAALIPAVRLARMSPARLIQVFAHAR